MSPSDDQSIIKLAKSALKLKRAGLSADQYSLFELIHRTSSHPHPNLLEIVSNVHGAELQSLIDTYRSLPPLRRAEADQPAAVSAGIDEPPRNATLPTKAFSHSVVTTTGEAGDPLRKVFHGTNSDFVDYRVGRGGRGQAIDSKGSIFFTSCPEAAGYHTTVNKGVVRGENAHGANIRPAFLNIENPFVLNLAGAYKDPKRVRNWILDAKEHGNDGVILRNVIDAEIGKSADVYIVFNNKQIVSSFAHEINSLAPSAKAVQAQQRRLRP